MTIDEIREKYLEEKSKEEGIKLTKKVLKLFSNGETVENIAKICEVSEDIVKEIIE
ncbi:hypothetical protein [Clostridium tarantellae]|uniref:hypothetical protein n=1 Tax=Clostridium tarantellae TaxID=39493 RepID=UPI0014789154|nr:hypothetical protein [Clostridium tarantellae]